MVTVKIIDGNCNITGKVAPLNGSHLDYDITVKSWYTTPNLPNINRVSTIGGEVIGEVTINTSTPESVEYFQVDYDTTNKSISVSLQNGSTYYSSLNYTRN